MTDNKAPIEQRLRESARAFHNHNVYDSEGDAVRLIVQANECDEAADLIDTLKARIAELETNHD